MDHHACVLWGHSTIYHPTREEVVDLRMCRCPVKDLSLRVRVSVRQSIIAFITTYCMSLQVTAYSIAYILGVHFRAGEWGKRPRCGSVVTCVKEGQSYYGAVVRFLSVDGDMCPGYACVQWFSEPDYIFGDTALGVRVTANGEEVIRSFGSIVRITQIDPSRVMVEDDTDNDCYMMMRDSGYDTRRRS